MNDERRKRKGVRRPGGRALLLLLAAAGHVRGDDGEPDLVPPPGFRVETASPHRGCFVAMALDTRGRPLVSSEKGPLDLLDDRDGDGVFETRTTFTDRVRNCQGICFVGTTVYAVGTAEGKHGLWRLPDADGDGRADSAELLVPFRDGGDHGTHAVVHGPDGRLYIASGNFSGLAVPPAAASPYHSILYEGSVIPPYYDPNGHAVQVRAPGGTVVRTDLEGRSPEIWCAGFRNHYDVAFNAAGDLFTFDSDMEWDLGLPWYRPVRFLHLVPGGDYGFRTGSYNWPAYYFDSLPAIADVGRGSPTGLVFYDHDRFPAKYRGALFALDWSMGRILVLFPRRAGASFTGTWEEFLVGRPKLNVTDAEVGPDGALYFVTGGWGTNGGLYRVVPQGEDRSLKTECQCPDDPVGEALRAPQPWSAWGRARIARLEARAGTTWRPSLRAAALDAGRPAPDRLRAIALQGIHDETDLLALLGDADPLVRARAAAAAREVSSEVVDRALVELLRDPDPWGVRHACEALEGSGRRVDPAVLLPLLSHHDRFVRFAARTTLERHGPPESGAVSCGTLDPRGAVERMLLAARAFTGQALDQSQDGHGPGQAAAERILTEIRRLLEEPPPVDVLLDLLRVVEVFGEQPGLRLEEPMRPVAERILRLVSCGDARIEREASLLVARWNPPGAARVLLGALARRPGHEREITLAYALRSLPAAAFDGADLLALLRWFEEAQTWAGGHSFRGYIDAMLRDVLAKLTAEERRGFLAGGTDALGPAVLTRMVELCEPAELAGLEPTLREVIRRERPRPAPGPCSPLACAAIAGIARAGGAGAAPWLRDLARQDAGALTPAVAALAPLRDPADWDLLVGALDRLDGPALERCLEAIRDGKRRSDDPAVWRSLLAAGRRLNDPRALQVHLILQSWLGAQVGRVQAFEWAEALAAWDRWVEAKTPSGAGAAKPPGPRRSRDDIVAALARREAEGRKASPGNGARIFEKARCRSCHTVNGEGGGLGPELTTVARRFSPAEIVEAVLEPSKTVSDLYRGTLLITEDETPFAGKLVSEDAQKVSLLLPDGTTRSFARSSIVRMEPSPRSLMPEGLFDALTIDEIADLLAFLGTAGPTHVAEGAGGAKTGEGVSATAGGAGGRPPVGTGTPEERIARSDGAPPSGSPFTFERREAAHELDVRFDGKWLVGYRYAPTLRKPYFFPVIGPSGKPIMPESPPDHPHHTGLFAAAEADGVQFWQGTTLDRIRHVRFVRTEAEGTSAAIETECAWEEHVASGTSEDFRTLLDDRRTVVVTPLGNGELFLDWAMTLTARKDVQLRKITHTGLPQCRVTGPMSVKAGGTITNAEGGVNEKGTYGKPSAWLDYSGDNEGTVEGIAVFSHPELSKPYHPPPWFTRDYGPFSPNPWLFAEDDAARRIPKGGTLAVRWGILIHKGTVVTGKVAERYVQYVKKGKLEAGD